jgi:putative FmdB family regulatory protein
MFEFECGKCGEAFEELATLAEVEAGEVACPACGAREVERLLSTFACGSDSAAGVAGGGGCGHAGFG